MTNAQLIAELQQYPPHLPVQVCLSGIIYQDSIMALAECDAIEAEEVFNRGTYLLVQSK